MLLKLRYNNNNNTTRNKNNTFYYGPGWGKFSSPQFLVGQVGFGQFTSGHDQALKDVTISTKKYLGICYNYALISAITITAPRNNNNSLCETWMGKTLFSPSFPYHLQPQVAPQTHT